MRRAMLLAAGVLITACSPDQPSTSAPPPPPTVARLSFPEPPDAPTGPNDAATSAFDTILDSIELGLVSVAQIQAFIDVGDARHAWLLSDLLRFAGPGIETDTMVGGFGSLTGAGIDGDVVAGRSAWNVVTNHLIAWDTPAPPDYQRLKGGLFTTVEEGWAPFFGDADADIDWRWLSWGGVFIDDRPLGNRGACPTPGCIPALDDPKLVPADEGDWYPDDGIVFGVTEGNESVAFPKNVMQVHEMVNITIGGRRFGIPYCTLCGSAQAFYTDEVPEGVEAPVLRTSGLLSRSNKVMYDLVTSSVFDTFTGDAVSGPLQDVGIMLDQNSVTVSTWAEWKDAHPDTMIVAEDGGIGRTYSTDPLRGRDDAGPIFPIGDTDPRLGVQDPVLGVLLADGTTVAFAVDLLRDATTDADEVRFEGITVTADGGGFVAEFDGQEVGAHEAFWFAWSQFHPATLLWPNDAEA